MKLPDPLLTIARRFLTVSPDTLLLDVLTKMNHLKGNNCDLLERELTINQVDIYANFTINVDFYNYTVTSCILILVENELVGIITERDVVKLVAESQDLQVPIGSLMTKKVITLKESEFTDVFMALALLSKNQIRHLPIVSETGKVVGIVTPETIRRILQPVNLLTMRRVRDIMKIEVISATLKTSVLTLARMMFEHRVSCIAIVSPLTELCDPPLFIPLGIVTERDIVQLQILGLDMANIQAETVMSQPLFCLHPEDSLWVAHQEMQRRFLRRLVVTGKQNELVGIITQSNIVKALEPVELYGVIDTLQQVLNKQTNQLIQANEQLKSQTEEVKKALQKEQEINQLKSQFIYIISHDFRNPITSIIGLANLLEIYGQQIAEDKKRQYLNCIVHSANRMLQMVESLLIIGKSDAGKLELNLVYLQLQVFCQELISEFEIYEGSQHKLTFLYQGKMDDKIYCDEDILRYILTNLLSNALKYSPQQSEVKLSVYLESDRAIFEVKDAGIGIPLEYRQHLFKSFHRADNVGNIPGTGLGLAIVKKYVDLLNGEIKVESEVNVGTTFTVKLPLNN